MEKSNDKEFINKNLNDDKVDDMIVEKDPKEEYINLYELKNLDENLNLLKKKMAALEMWKTVNESTGKLCLGDLANESDFTLDDSNLLI